MFPTHQRHDMTGSKFLSKSVDTCVMSLFSKHQRRLLPYREKLVTRNVVTLVEETIFAK
ncbi:MAG: hypothetical protein Q4C70_10205 [Planctomycetia bacterium]|nr:hypothetical protein [Planctomycetia bacterium]